MIRSPRAFGRPAPTVIMPSACPLWLGPPLCERVLQLQALTRRSDPLKQAIIRERNRSHAQGYPIRNTRLIARDIQVHIRHLKRRIKYLEAQALDLIEKLS